MSIYWCKTCKVPLHGKKCSACGKSGKYMAQDVRPVFPEEVLLMEILLHKRGELRGKSVWNTKGNRYYVDGERVDFSLQKTIEEWEPEQVRNVWEEEKRQILDSLNEQFVNQCERFARANEQHLQEIEFTALEFVNRVKTEYQNSIPVVSFSGGKDSTVVSSLVRRALGTPKILHVFGDTTLEMPNTYDYIKQFRTSHRQVPFFQPSSHHDFLDLCERIGPPSRVMRWCCTVFKTGPIGDLFERFGDSNILTFYGVRRSESVRRSKYQAVMRSPKIARQIVASPIIDWTDFDIWLYLLATGEPFNDSYRLGFSRVGCWCCPSNSDWSFFLSQIVFPKEAAHWRDFLIAFAKRIGKKDAEVYVDSGNWKARQGGNGMETNFGTVKFEPCATEDTARNYYLNKPILSQLYEYFKPFGTLDFDAGKSMLGEVYVKDRITGEPVLLLQGRKGQNHLKVVSLRKENLRLLLTRIECQIRKYQACFGCGGCPSICPAKAISLIGDDYVIDAKKCVGCMKCVAHFDQGCLVTKVTQTRRTPA